jgi:DNA polymerase V
MIPVNRLRVSVHWICDVPVDDQRLIPSTAVRLIDRIFRGGLIYAKAGISLSKIRPRSLGQGHLFSGDKTNDRVTATMDVINQRFGHNTVKPARQLGDQWRMKQDFYRQVI